MKHLTYFLSFVLLLAFSACNDDFDLIEEGVSLPIVYGFIDLGNDTQYIRVEKGFAGEDLNAFEGAQEEDSIYYKDITVSLVDVTSGDKFELERINGTDDGYVRAEGDFLKDPNILYRIPNIDLGFTGGEKVRLEIERGDNLPTITSSTTVLNPVILQGPTNDKPVHFTYNMKSFQLRTHEEVAIVGLKMNIYIRERSTLDPTQVEIVEIPWQMVSSFITDRTKDFQFPKVEGRLFYTTIAANLDMTKPVVREFSHFDIIVEGGGEEILDYRRIARANSGLTGAQELPLYSNISEGGIGIFSSKYNALYENFSILPQTRDSLVNSPILKGLNFVN